MIFESQRVARGRRTKRDKAIFEREEEEEEEGRERGGGGTGHPGCFLGVRHKARR